MKYRRLGKTSLKTSIIGMGCWAFGGGEYWGAKSQGAINQIVSRGLDLGINYFDTAEMYNAGASEKSLGEAFLLNKRRSDAIIGTKISPSNCHPDTLRAHLDQSLKNLQMDYVDIYMIHWPIEAHSIEHFTTNNSLINNPATIESAFITLQELQDEGKITHIGVSNHGIVQMDKILKLNVDLVVNELPYNLFSRAIEVEIEPFCKSNNIGIFGYMALQQGILAGIYEKIEDVPPPQAHSRHFMQKRGMAPNGKNYSRHNEAGIENEMLSVLLEMKRISLEEDISVAQLALAWAISNENISSTLVGSSSVKRWEENAKIADYSLPNAIKDELNKLTEPILNKLGDNPDYYENRTNSRIY
jgi:aryl-alcohol dehydrogenase-like predicted oxidoreductase